MKQAPRYGQDVTLVPLSGIQFLDFAVRIDGKTQHWFSEHAVTENGETRQRLLQLEKREYDLVDSITGARVDEGEAYPIATSEALNMFQRQWTPIPYFRIIGVDAQRAEVHDRGPTNWARLHIAGLDAPDADGNTHRVVLAFDTDVQQANRVEDGIYVMPTRQDALTEDRFSFAPGLADLNWFADQPWMDDWLSESFAARPTKQKSRKKDDDDAVPRLFEYIARYMALVQMLAEVLPFPRIRLIDVFSEQLNYRPIPVDLIVDVGNNRTCGILIEDQSDGASNLDLSRSDPLSLRDLSRPELVHGDAFQSRVEFGRAYFGDELISRRSGRSRAFQWPSFVRIGPEAARLSVGGSGTEGVTGMSSPKRYLWDDRPIGQVWRTRRPEKNDTEVVSGAMMRFLTENGELLSRRRRRRDASSAQPAIRPKFSRSSLFMMLMSEILAQTISAINSPERRGRQSHTDVPRYLRNIIMTLPPATPLAERRIMAERVDYAVELVWSAMGWNASPLRSQIVAMPKVKIRLDEATATQLVYLYTEIVQKSGGDPRSFFQIAGKTRPEHGVEPSLRVASLDIGGGTSDLIVVTYAIQNKTKRTIRPEQDFREGFRVAGDDILHAVIANHVLSAIEHAMRQAGVEHSKALLRGIVGADRGGTSEQERQFRRRFVLQLLEPAALALLGQLEGRPQYAENSMLEQRIGAAWTADCAEAHSISVEFNRLAERAGAKGFVLADVDIVVPSDEINATVQATMGQALAIFSEIVASLDCDILLLSGRPSRLPVISDIVVSTLGVRPDRVVPMHRYRTGKWYPFRDTLDRIADPKTTVAVGAMLCFFAEGQIENFKVSTQHLTVRSTARFIGEMPNEENRILHSDILFSDIDLEAKAHDTRTATVAVETQTTTIGFRQVPLERWPASPLYVVELRQSPDSRVPINYPIRVTLEQGEASDDDGDEAFREDFVISEILDPDGDPPPRTDAICRLQTMKNSSGYWLDTGIISDY
jgi:hypothetical protein